MISVLIFLWYRMCSLECWSWCLDIWVFFWQVQPKLAQGICLYCGLLCVVWCMRLSPRFSDLQRWWRYSPLMIGFSVMMCEGWWTWILFHHGWRNGGFSTSKALFSFLPAWGWMNIRTSAWQKRGHQWGVGPWLCWGDLNDLCTYFSTRLRVGRIGVWWVDPHSYSL